MALLEGGLPPIPAKLRSQVKQFYEARKTDITNKLDNRMIKVLRMASRLAPKKLLDIACGRGMFLRLLRERLPDAALVGVDIAASSVEFTRNAGFEAHVADVSRSLPFSDGEFDVIVFGEVIEHLVDPDAALVEISRVLKIGGALVLTTPNLASWFNRVLLVAGIQPIFTETSLHANLGRRFTALGQMKPTQGHLKIFTLSALKEMLSANGYAIERIEGATFPEANLASALDRLFSYVPAFASNFVVLARSNGQCRSVYAVREASIVFDQASLEQL